MTDENYGPLEMGRGEMKRAVELPEEFRDGGTVDFSNWDPIGWVYDGVLHYFAGHGPEDETGGWTWEGPYVLAEEKPNG